MEEEIKKIVSRKIGQTLGLLETQKIPISVLMQVKQNFWHLHNDIIQTIKKGEGVRK